MRLLPRDWLAVNRGRGLRYGQRGGDDDCIVQAAVMTIRYDTHSAGSLKGQVDDDRSGRPSEVGLASYIKRPLVCNAVMRDQPTRW
jgi:hypothetical protein